jgi:hypothetical protein
MIQNNNNANENNIAIPWYKRTINANIQQEAQISNVKFNINIPPRPEQPKEEVRQEQEQEQEAEQPEEQPETESKLARESHPNPYPWVVPKKGKQPDEKPTGAGVPVFTFESLKESALSLGESVWNLLSEQQKREFLFNAAQGVNPFINQKQLLKGIDFAVSYDYTHFNMGKYYSGLVAESGIVVATVILIIAAIAIPGIPPF